MSCVYLNLCYILDNGPKNKDFFKYSHINTLLFSSLCNFFYLSLELKYDHNQRC